MRSLYDPKGSPELPDALELLKTVGGPTVPLEELDATPFQQALDTLQLLLDLWSGRQVALQAEVAALETAIEQLPTRAPEGEWDPPVDPPPPELVPAWGHTAVYSHRDREGLTDFGPALRLTSARFESFTDGGSDVVLGMTPTEAGEFRMRELPTMRRCVELLVPALARLMEPLYSTPLYTGRPLRFAVLSLADDNQLDPNWRWISTADYQRSLSPRQRLGYFLLYPAGGRDKAQHQQQQQTFGYSMWDTTLCRPETANEWDADCAALDTPLQWPTMSDLIRFIHGSMKGSSFALQAVLDLADSSGLQAASEAVAHMERLELLFQRVRRLRARLLERCTLPPTTPLMAAICSESNIPLNTRLEEVDAPRLAALMRRAACRPSGRSWPSSHTLNPRDPLSPALVKTTSSSTATSSNA